MYTCAKLHLLILRNCNIVTLYHIKLGIQIKEIIVVIFLSVRTSDCIEQITGIALTHKWWATYA